MKKNLSVKHITLLILMISLVCLQTVFSNFVICVGEDGHVDFDISITNDKLATNHHIHEHGDTPYNTDDTVIVTEKHNHGCYDILFSFCAEYAKIKAKIVSVVQIDHSRFTAPFHNAFDSVSHASETSFTVSHSPPGDSMYLSCNISLLI